MAAPTKDERIAKLEAEVAALTDLAQRPVASLARLEACVARLRVKFPLPGDEPPRPRLTLLEGGDDA